MNSLFTEANIGELATRLCEGIEKHAQGSQNNRPWTAAVYQTLKDEAIDRQWTIHPKEKPYKGEYLCDFTLFEEGYGCRIACESQWWWDTDPLHGLEWAFDKLRGVKSDLKLFIYEGKDGHLETLASKYLEGNAHLSKGKTFLILRWSKDHFENWFWIVPQDGIQPGAILFTRLQDFSAKIPDFVIDKHGNNLAVRCPDCKNAYIISEMLERMTPRPCPHCGESSAGFRDGKAFVHRI